MQQLPLDEAGEGHIWTTLKALAALLEERPLVLESYLCFETGPQGLLPEDYESASYAGSQAYGELIEAQQVTVTAQGDQIHYLFDEDDRLVGLLERPNQLTLFEWAETTEGFPYVAVAKSYSLNDSGPVLFLVNRVGEMHVNEVLDAAAFQF